MKSIPRTTYRALTFATKKAREDAAIWATSASLVLPTCFGKTGAGELVGSFRNGCLGRSSARLAPASTRLLSSSTRDGMAALSARYIWAASGRSNRSVKVVYGCGGARWTSSAISRVEDVRARLRNVMEPDLQSDLETLNFVKNITVEGAAVSFDLVFNTPAHPNKEALRHSAVDAVKELPWVETVTISVSAEHRPRKRPNPKTQAAASSGLKDVKRIIAVSSAKGGVGKSTVSVNLAYALALLGGKVGIFDADLQGPSLPVMVALDNPKVTKSAKSDALIEALEYEGVKLMSYGFSAKAQKGEAAVMRGPMVATTVATLLKTTDWGALDYLVIDFPPGTGDIQLTLCQELSIDGAVIVTTPQKLAFVDVIKGLHMFDSLQVPIVGLVENMSYFDCDAGKRYFPFGKGHAERLSEYGTPPPVVLPIRQQVSESGDGGRPFVLGGEGSEAECGALMMRLAASVVQQITKLEIAGDTAPLVEYDAEGKFVTVWPVTGSAVKWSIPHLRAACLSAKKPPPVTATTRPLSISPKGRYAVEVKWSDGHSSILPYLLLLKGPLDQ